MIPKPFAILVVLCALLPAQEAASPLEKAIAREADAALAKPPWMGLVVGAFVGESECIRGFGRMSEDDGVVPGADTLFEIGSITKTFTGILLAMAVLDERVKLDTPIASILPEGSVVPDFEGTPITLLDLATHASALPRLPPNMSPLAKDPYATYSRKDLIEGVAKAKLSRRPGEKSTYSNFGTGLLGECLSMQEKRSYAEILQSRLLAPAGLSDTMLVVPEKESGRLAPGHVVKGNPPAIAKTHNWNFDALAPAGALRSNAKDMVRYLRLQTGHGDPGLVAACRFSHAARFVDPAGRMDVGLGWHRRKPKEKDGPTLVWHNGGTGGYRSFAGFIEGRDCGVVVLANATREEVDAIGVAILEGLARN